MVWAGPIAWCLQGASADVLHLQDGRVWRGQVERFDPDRAELHFQVILDGPTGKGVSMRRWPLDEIHFVEFGQSRQESELLSPRDDTVEATDDRAAIALWRRAWKKHRSFLSFPNSAAGAFGLGLVARLLATGNRHDAAEALVISAEIRQEDWNEARRVRATVSSLRGQAALGHWEAAKRAAAEVLLSEGRGDSNLVLEAHRVLGQAGLVSFRVLVEEAPRWRDDDERRTEGEALYEQGLNHFLSISLFHAAKREAAAEALWNVCELYQLAGHPRKAAAVAEELVALHGDSPWGEKARALKLEGEE